MPGFEPFKYSECLPRRSQGALPKFLVVKANQSDEVLLLRLLSGSIDLKNTTMGLTILQRVNYTFPDYKLNSRMSAKLVLEALRLNGTSLSKAEVYYSNCHKFGNRKLFKNLLLELSNFFYQKQKKSHATGFLHLYRSVELISYCFPLYFASKGKSYEKSYSSLKDFFTKVEGELNFFKKFVNHHLFNSDPTILDLNLSLKIRGPKTELREQYFRALFKLCENNNAIEIKGSTLNTEIIITRRGLTSLIYDLRNRYFHLLTGDYNDNFSSSELAEIDFFYENVNDIILNWITQIYMEILSSMAE